MSMSPSTACSPGRVLVPTARSSASASNRGAFGGGFWAYSPEIHRQNGLGASTVARDMLRLVLPKGSLERATLDLFDAADLGVSRSSSVSYRATINDPRIDDVRILRPQEIPRYVAEGLFDLGITGRDWIEETSSEVVSLGQLQYSKASSRPIRVVLAVPDDSTFQRVEDLPAGVRVSTEYPELTRRFFEKRGV